ncbi:GcrA family cell cycle regulator [Brucella intermedia GD04153]|uniref:GcrA family cell cycle regulator n=1 Tax=Brucella intermedia GD04153 TaxID=2975438 RepID=A0AA42H0H8_9HYPH|nr:GcrA family cell cycle regulator [Brucella intermedia]MDH0125759.1 GcrA family cell cycle regulator [Brucella intermedia GD04153]
MLDKLTRPHEGFPLADISRHQCKWPVNRARAGELHLFCGEVVQNGQPYCEEHCRKAYTGKAERFISRSLK